MAFVPPCEHLPATLSRWDSGVKCMVQSMGLGNLMTWVEVLAELTSCVELGANYIASLCLVSHLESTFNNISQAGLKFKSVSLGKVLIGSKHFLSLSFLLLPQTESGTC